MPTSRKLIPLALPFVLTAFLLPLSPAGICVEPAAPGAGSILREMSATLAAAVQLSFRAERHLDTGLITGRDTPEDAKIEVLVQRPNKIAAQSASNDTTRSFYADGQTATLVDRKMNFYAAVPMQTSIDGLVARLDERFGFTPPLAEFLLSDSYTAMSKSIRKSAVAGKEKIGGTECWRLSLIGDLADADLWVGVKDHLPRRLIATFKRREGRPKLSVNFSNWNLAASARNQDFAFIPPKGARRIEMIPIATQSKDAPGTH